MEYYAGLDVSLKDTFVSVVDEDGNVVKEKMVSTNSKSLSGYLRGLD